MVDDQGNPVPLEDGRLSVALVLSYPDLFLQQVGLDLVIVEYFDYGGVRLGATWSGRARTPRRLGAGRASRDRDQ